MKKLAPIILISLLFYGCKDDDSVEPNLTDLTLEDLSVNQAVLDKAFSNVANKITYDVIKNTFKSSGTKEEFIIAMNKKTEGLLLTAANDTQPAMAIYLKFSGVDGSSEITKRVLGILSAKSPIDTYYELIEQASKNNDHKGWILIQSYSQGSTAQGQALPAEEISLNYEKIRYAIDLKQILLSSASDEEHQAAIKRYVLENSWPRVMIALLLPAIQQARESNNPDPLSQWLNNEVVKTIGGNIDREIMRRFEAAGYAGSLDILINEDFDNSNQFSASADILRARYQVTLMFIWNEIWEQYS